MRDKDIVDDSKPCDCEKCDCANQIRCGNRMCDCCRMETMRHINRKEKKG